MQFKPALVIRSLASFTNVGQIDVDCRPTQSLHALKEKNKRECTSRDLVRNRTLSALDSKPLQLDRQLPIANPACARAHSEANALPRGSSQSLTPGATRECRSRFSHDHPIVSHVRLLRQIKDLCDFRNHFDLSSLGRFNRPYGPKCSRCAHLLSDVEANGYYALQWSELTTGIRVEYPLDRELTLEIAAASGTAPQHDVVLVNHTL